MSTMTINSSTITCDCDQELSLLDYKPGSLARCPNCDVPFMVPLDEEPSAECYDGPEVAVEAEEASFDFTDMILLWFFSGIPGLVIGYTLAAMCAGGAILINVFHNLLPKFVIVMPLIIVAFMALTPAMFGVGVGVGVGYTAHLLKSRHVGSAFMVGLFWGIFGLACYPWLAELGTPKGTEFFDDILMPFVELMVGASLNFEWLAKPEPADIEPWIVRSVLWGSGILGVLFACSKSVEIVEDRPEDPSDLGLGY